MKQTKKYGLIFFLPAFFVFCSDNRKSADYYFENKQTITEMRQLYEELYAHQPFSAGFSDKSFNYFVLEINTDTVRYIYNTENSWQQLYSAVVRFNYDTAKLKNLGEKMHAVKCLWLSKSYFYVDGERENVTFLSFRSVASNSKFVENKYFMLVFLPRPIATTFTIGRNRTGELVKIDSLVYFMIGSGFR
ncbi:MAG: hypothetical protein C5B59_20630 [Bacteroidetes bacterium]|nr:MAG: hypothetical protein C5B59_20630 [Bacteroidota bacterium]